ncbi:hypothetical protein ACP4OV_009280 [Aristida adscensionis]
MAVLPGRLAAVAWLAVAVCLAAAMTGCLCLEAASAGGSTGTIVIPGRIIPKTPPLPPPPQAITPRRQMQFLVGVSQSIPAFVQSAAASSSAPTRLLRRDDVHHHPHGRIIAPLVEIPHTSSSTTPTRD